MLLQKFKFTFKTRAIKDAAGNEIGRTKKHPAMEVEIPVLSPDEVIAILSAKNEDGTFVNPKSAELILSSLADVPYQQARSQFDDIIESFGADDSKVLTPAGLNLDQLSWEYIANLPPSTRGATAITEEEYKAFFADYVAVVVSATGAEVARVENHTKCFAKPTEVKGNKRAIGLLLTGLNTYAANSPNLEEHARIVDRLVNKFDTWAKAEEKDLAALL